MTRLSICKAGPPTDRLLGKFPTHHQGSQVIKRPRGMEYMTLKGITEVGFRPLLRQLSSQTKVLPRAVLISWLPCCQRLCPAGPHLPCCWPGSRDSALQEADGSRAYCAVSQTYRLKTWGLRFIIPQFSSVMLLLIVYEWLLMLLVNYRFELNLH